MTNTAPRLAIIRRIYFYAVALIAYIISLVALDSLLSTMSDIWLTNTGLFTVGGYSYARENIARSIGFLIVAVPLFLLHWRAMQQRSEPIEISSALRKLYLYAAQGVALGYALVALHAIISGAARLALGAPVSANPLLPSDWLHRLAMLLIAGGCILYWRRILTRDGDYGGEVRWAATMRRLYHSAVGLSGLALLITGCALVLDALLQWALSLWLPTIGQGWFADQIADGVAAALIGAILMRLAWSSWSQIVAVHSGEALSPLRRLYFYLAVVISALATLIPLAIVFRILLLFALGQRDGSWTSVLLACVSPLSYAPWGFVAWRWYWRGLASEATRFGETGEGATVRRIYFYAVAATGLALMWVGAVSILQSILDVVLTADSFGEIAIWRELVATGLSLVMVGAPVWAFHWQSVQKVARGSDAAGRAERGSLPRRVYLYGVALVGAVLILVFLAQFLYRLFLHLLGDINVDVFGPQTAEELARSLIAVVLWAVHLLALRTDLRMGGGDDAVIERRERLQTKIASMETELTALRAELESMEMQ